MPNINTLLDEHVVLKYEMADRIFGHAYLPRLQDPEDLAWFLTKHRGEEIPRYELLGEITRCYVAGVEKFAAAHNIPMVTFERGQDKEDLVKPYFDRFREQGGREEVVLIGLSQERARAFQAPRKKDRERGKFNPNRRWVFVNHVYFYIWDRDFGPTFLCYCTYAPFGLTFCLNGHQWLVQRLRMSGHEVEQLDNAIGSVDQPEALRRLCRRFKAAHILRWFDRWTRYLPSPLSAKDRRAGYVYRLSTLQLEVARTEVFDRPLHGRQFFEEVVYQQLDLGRPSRLQLVFGRQLRPRRRGRGKHKGRRQKPPARTRVFNAGTHVSLHVEYGHTHVKQYWKYNRCLRTETTFNDTYDVRVGRTLTNENLARLMAIGIDYNRRLLALERISCRPSPASSDFQKLVSPTGPRGRRAPGFRFGNPRVVALFWTLCSFQLNAFGSFRCRQLRSLMEEYLAAPYSQGQVAYDLWRLLQKGLITRLAGTHRYQLTDEGRMWVSFCSSLYSHVLCPAIRQHRPAQPSSRIRTAYRAYEKEIARLVATWRAA